MKILFIFLALNLGALILNASESQSNSYNENAQWAHRDDSKSRRIRHHKHRRHDHTRGLRYYGRRSHWGYGAGNPYGYPLIREVPVLQEVPVVAPMQEGPVMQETTTTTTTTTTNSDPKTPRPPLPPPPPDSDEQTRQAD
jgi:hypothetical protein